jgi:hypothetical protein
MPTIIMDVASASREDWDNICDFVEDAKSRRQQELDNFTQEGEAFDIIRRRLQSEIDSWSDTAKIAVGMLAHLERIEIDPEP